MNNKEFIALISEKLNMSAKDAGAFMAGLTTEMTSQFEEGATLSVSGFGSFEVKKKLERVLVNPSTKQRMLVPPKLVLSFKPSTILKEKL